MKERHSLTHFPDGNRSQIWGPASAVPRQALQGHLQPFLGVTPGRKKTLCSGVGVVILMVLDCYQSPEAPDAIGLLLERGHLAFRWEVMCVLVAAFPGPASITEQTRQLAAPLQ